MSEFDEGGDSQDFEEPTMDNVDFAEADEVQDGVSIDSVESVDEGEVVDFQDDADTETSELQDYDDNVSSEEISESIDDSYDEQSEEDYIESEELQDESELSPAELKEQADRKVDEAQQEAEEWADSNGYDTWSDGTPRQGCDLSNESDDDANELQDESQLSPSELKEIADKEAADAQREAEEWADNGGANRWSDGTLREGHEDDSYDRSTNELQQMEEEGLRPQQEYQAAKEAQEAEEEGIRQKQEYDKMQEEMHDSYNAEVESDIADKENEISNLDYQYDQAKQSIDVSSSDEERDYWKERSNEIWKDRDNASYEVNQLRNQKK